MKRCTKCGEEKPLEAYYRHAQAKDGRHSRCKVCINDDVADYKRRNPDKVREIGNKRTRRWAKANPERRAEIERKSREKHRAKYLAMRKRYREEHKEEIAAKWAEYFEKNQERLRAKARNEYDPEKKRASRTPEQLRQARERRRARLLEAYVADVDYDEILIRDAGICGICGEQIFENPEIDHIVPLAADGTHEPDNCQLAHLACNRRKGSKTGFRLAA